MASGGAPDRDPVRTCGRIGSLDETCSSRSTSRVITTCRRYSPVKMIILCTERGHRNNKSHAEAWRAAEPLAAADCDRTCHLCKEESEHVLHIVRIATKKITPERMIITHKYCVKDARQNCYLRAAACVCNDCCRRPRRRGVAGHIARGGPDNSPIIRGHTRALLRRAPAGNR